MPLLCNKSELPAVASGLAVGFIIALAVAPTITRSLFGVTAFDPWTFTMSAAVLAAIAVIATYLPVRRSVSLDPHDRAANAAIIRSE